MTLANALLEEINKTYLPNDTPTLQSNIKAVMAAYHAIDSSISTTFAFTSETTGLAVKDVYDVLIDSYETELGNQFSSTVPQSYERAALVSLYFNHYSLIGPKLEEAINTGNRAEAWYEIRYNSNGGTSASQGIAKPAICRSGKVWSV